MKNSFSIVVLAIIAGIFFVASVPVKQITVKNGFYPVAVRAVVDKKCYGCHSLKGKSQDAKDALMWDSLPGLQKGKIVATLDHIIEVLDENKMPPEEMLKKYPDAKLLQVEKDLLRQWAVAKSDSLLK